MFSKACEYALKIMIYLSSQQDADKLAGVKDIASEIDSPVAFTAKILQQLVRAGLLQSLRGPSGGFRMADREISLLEVVVAIDGDGLVTNCVLGLDECSGKNPCPVHHKMVGVRDEFKAVLSGTLLSAFKDDIAAGMSVLKND